MTAGLLDDWQTTAKCKPPPGKVARSGQKKKEFKNKIEKEKSNNKVEIV